MLRLSGDLTREPFQCGQMIKITHRPVFEFEKEERLRRLLPVRDAFGRATYFLGRYFLLPMIGGGFVAWLLRSLLPVSPEAAAIAGLITAFAASVYASLKLKRHRRNELLRERARLDATVIETIDVEVEKAWSLENCDCCSVTFLFKVGEKDFVFIETFDIHEPWLKEFPTRRMKIERERDAKTLWAVSPEGPPIVAAELPFEVEDVLSDGGAECEILNHDELPESVRAAVSAA